MCKCKKKEEKTGCVVCKVAKGVVKIAAVTTGTLFTVYMLNLDQKLLGWTYVQVNGIFDRKKTDIKF